MTERWAVNASPLIVLSKIDRQHLLTDLAGETVIPEAVAREIEAGPEDDPARRFLRSRSLPVVAVTAEPVVLAWDLGAGETSVLSYALQQPGWKAVLDDGMARRCARTLKLPLIGTLGVIIRAQQSGLIASTVPVLKDLQAIGMRLDDNVIRDALRRTTGEVWD